jgi:small-conductance mechanosensitive channel
MHVIVPNSKLSAATFVNTSRPREDCRFHAVAMVTFHDDLDQVVQLATELADELQREDPRAVASYRPFAFIECFQPGYVELRTWLCAKSWDAHFGLRDVFLRRLQQRLREHGVAIASPHRTLEISRARVEMAPLHLPEAPVVSDAERS